MPPQALSEPDGEFFFFFEFFHSMPPVKLIAVDQSISSEHFFPRRRVGMKFENAVE